MKAHNSAVSFAVTIFAALALAAPVAAGEQVPLRGRFAGIATATSFNFPIACGVTTGAGNAAHLGKFMFEHPHCANLQTFGLAGTFRFVAANGDEVFADFSGQSSATPTPGVRLVVGTATITGGTGRFAGATGSFALQRLFDSATNRTAGWFDGTISSPGTRR